MPFPQGPNFQRFPRFAPASRPKNGPVFAVGGRAIVTGQSGDRVALTDDGGTTALAAIADGVEVEVLAWRPRRGSARYRVISSDGLEGWVDAASLKALQPPSPEFGRAGDSSSRLTLPMRGTRATASRTRSAPALADAATIKTVTRGTKTTRIGTR